jgi:hypothetical protein
MLTLNKTVRSRRAVAATLALLTVVLGGCADSSGGSAGADAHSNLNAQVQLSLKALLKQIGGGYGDQSPHPARAVRASRHAAVTLVEQDEANTGTPSGDPNAQVYVITASGVFSGDKAKVPPGATLPSGSHLTFIVDATSMSVSDVYINNRDVDLRPLGQVTVLS